MGKEQPYTGKLGVGSEEAKVCEICQSFPANINPVCLNRVKTYVYIQEISEKHLDQSGN